MIYFACFMCFCLGVVFGLIIFLFLLEKGCSTNKLLYIPPPDPQLEKDLKDMREGLIESKGDPTGALSYRITELQEDAD